MFVEYCNYNKYIEDYSKELANIAFAIEQGIDGICTTVYLLREIKPYARKDLILSAPIDYPLGYSTTKARMNAVFEVARSGANAIDYVPNHYLLKTGFTKLKEELKEINAIVKDYNITLRIFLNHQYNVDILALIKFYNDFGVSVFYPTIGYHHDDFSDNALICEKIQNKGGSFAIFNGYVWSKHQIDILKESDFFGVRLYDFKFGVYKI